VGTILYYILDNCF